MSRPPTIPGHPLKKRLLYVTDRCWDHITAEADRHGLKVGVFLDQAFAKRGGWNEVSGE